MTTRAVVSLRPVAHDRTVARVLDKTDESSLPVEVVLRIRDPCTPGTVARVGVDTGHAEGRGTPEVSDAVDLRILVTQASHTRFRDPSEKAPSPHAGQRKILKNFGE